MIHMITIFLMINDPLWAESISSFHFFGGSPCRTDMAFVPRITCAVITRNICGMFRSHLSDGIKHLRGACNVSPAR